MEGLSRLSSADQTEANLSKLVESREMRVLLTLSYSLQMLRRLVQYASDDPLAEVRGVVRNACREAFFVHVRRVAAFFWKHPAGEDTARLFLPTWTPPASIAERLSRRWKQAAPFVAPMSRYRITADPGGPEPTPLSLTALAETVADCDAAVQAFIDACAAERVELLPEIQVLLDPAYD